ncbi:hypothetical protein QQ045_014859 [Rhodiola kirilowii]
MTAATAPSLISSSSPTPLRPVNPSTPPHYNLSNSLLPHSDQNYPNPTTDALPSLPNLTTPTSQLNLTASSPPSATSTPSSMAYKMASTIQCYQRRCAMCLSLERLRGKITSTKSTGFDFFRNITLTELLVTRILVV